MQLFVYPLALGNGARLFSDGLKARLSLVDSDAYDNGVLHLAYRPAE